MKFLSHQIEKAAAAYTKLKQYKVIYIQGKPRSGKTATALKVAEMSKLTSWLILCPKNAMPGWQLFLEDKELGLTNQYYVANYEQVMTRYKVEGKIKYRLKLDKTKFTGLILDEAHNFGKVGKSNIRIKMTRALCREYPTILLSGTAVVESPNGIFHQMAVTKYSPFKFSNFYQFHKAWGIPAKTRIGQELVNDYSKYKPGLLAEIAKYSIYMTQADAGITIEAVDKLHYVELSTKTKELYNQAVATKVLHLDELILLDTKAKERVSLHMLESGVAKLDDTYIFIGNTEKIDYILKTFGDTEDMGIMCHFVAERQLLAKHFKHANIYSSTSHAEGIDLSHLSHFIIISSSYSGAKFIQRRERIININTSNTTTVHHILVKDAVSDQVYINVSKKMDFNNSTYKRNTLS